VPVISGALDMRFRSQDPEPFANKLLAMMRHEFGGARGEDREYKINNVLREPDLPDQRRNEAKRRSMRFCAS